MSSITAQQAKLDLELVPKRKGLRLENATGDSFLERLKENLHFKLSLMLLLSLRDILHFSPLQMFRMDKKKNFFLNLETFRDIFQIFLRVHGQDFDELPIDEVIVSFFKELGHTGEIKSIIDVVGMYYKKNVDFIELLWEDFTYQIDNRVSRINKIGTHTFRDDYLINTLRFVSANEESQIYGARLPESMTSPEMRETKAYKTYVDYATRVIPPKKARKFKKPASPKLTTVPTLPKEPIKKSKRVKRLAKKSTHAPIAGVVIKDTPDSSESDNESWGDSDDDNESYDNDDEGSENDVDSAQEEEYVHTTDYSVPTNEETDDENMEFDDEEYDDLYKDVNMRSKVTEHDKVGKGGVEMTNATRESGSQEKLYEQVVKDAHVTLTTSRKTEGSKQSSSVSSDFESKFLILDNVPPVIDEVASMMSVKDIIKDEVKTQLPQILPKEVSEFATPVIQSSINKSLENVIFTKSSSQPKSTYEAVASLIEFDLKKILLDKIEKSKSYQAAPEHKELYEALGQIFQA
ncbi:hypothetical protein Tco_0656436 [Tanacetum coccineum]|uniref:Uncharacterized protein n=1 Tax=Tanacetum coccineum TaxID=301880 RepID=A0ABQ4X8R3_9ASTR